jgi:hypothetical protein
LFCALIAQNQSAPKIQLSKALESDFKFNIIKIENGVIQQIRTV